MANAVFSQCVLHQNQPLRADVNERVSWINYQTLLLTKLLNQSVLAYLALLGPSVSSWVLLGPTWSFLVLLSPSGSFWVLPGPFWSFWVLLDPSGSFWVLLNQFLLTLLVLT